MRRDSFSVLILVTLVTIAAMLAGVTRFPDAAWVRAVSRAAVFGPWIERLAELYRRPESEISNDELEVKGGPMIVYEIDLEKAEARPRVWVPQEAGIFEQPSEASHRFATVPATSNLLLFDRMGDWYRVRLGDRKGWVLLPAYQESTAPPFGSEPDPPLPVPARPPDPEVLAAARQLLEDEVEPGSLGPYILYTDVRDRELLSELSDLSEGLESAYSGRYGLTPLAGVAEAVVLFASRESYGEFQRADPSLRSLVAPGIVRRGVLATYTGGRSHEEVATTLVHELVHLINRRAVGPALPPWLDEGLADDIAQSRIVGGRIVIGTLGGSYRRSGNRIEFRGGRAAAVELLRALDRGTLPSLEALLELDWGEFQTGGDRSLRYGQSSFFVRSLLDSPNSALALGFRDFLAEVSRGGPLTPQALRERLALPWNVLDRRLASFVRFQAVDEGSPAAPESDSSSRHASEPSS